MDGRDIGSVVFPSSEIKIFLETEVKERAKRRQIDLQKHGEFLSIEEIVNDFNIRDKRDSERKTAPLLKMPDAITIDTTNNNIDKVVEIVMDILAQKEII